MSVVTRAFFAIPGTGPGDSSLGDEIYGGVGGRSSKAEVGRSKGSESVRLSSSKAVKGSLRGTEVVRPGGYAPRES